MGNLERYSALVGRLQSARGYELSERTSMNKRTVARHTMALWNIALSGGLAHDLL